MQYNRLTCIMDSVGDIATKTCSEMGPGLCHCHHVGNQHCLIILANHDSFKIHWQQSWFIPLVINLYLSVVLWSFFKSVPWTRAIFPRDQTTTWKKQFTLILFVLNRNPTPTSWVVVVEIWLTELLPSQNGILPTIWSSPCRRCFPTLHLRLNKIWRSENLWEKGHGYFDYL